MLHLIQDKTARDLIRSRRLLYILGILVTAKVLKDIASSAFSSAASGASSRAQTPDTPTPQPTPRAPVPPPATLSTPSGSNSIPPSSGKSPDLQSLAEGHHSHLHTSITNGLTNSTTTQEHISGAITEQIVNNAVAEEVTNQAVDQVATKAVQGIFSRIISGILAVLGWIFSAIFSG